MKCEMCGYEYEEHSCSGCGGGGCGTCICPVCGYSSPPPSRLGTLIKRIRGEENVDK